MAATGGSDSDDEMAIVVASKAEPTGDSRTRVVRGICEAVVQFSPGRIDPPAQGSTVDIVQARKLIGLLSSITGLVGAKMQPNMLTQALAIVPSSMRVSTDVGTRKVAGQGQMTYPPCIQSASIGVDLVTVRKLAAFIRADGVSLYTQAVRDALGVTEEGGVRWTRGRTAEEEDTAMTNFFKLYQYVPNPVAPKPCECSRAIQQLPRLMMAPSSLN